MTTSTMIRASSLGELFDCALRWKAKHIDKRLMSTSGAAHLGTSIHAGAAAFDAARINGEEVSIDDCSGVVVDSIYHPSYDVDWGEITQSAAEKIALPLLRKYCEEIAPQFNYIAVEALCDPVEFEDLHITITGTTDRVYQAEDGTLGICDLKTGKTAVSADGVCKTAGHKAQLGMYELLASSMLGEAVTAPAHIIGLQTGSTSKAQRVAIGTVTGTAEAVIGTEGHPGLLQLASRIITEELWTANNRSSLCSPKFCPIYAECIYK